MDSLFTGIYDTYNNLTFTSFIITMLVSLLVGLIISITYMYKTKVSKSFVTTLTILPAVVSMIIILVSGNIGAGVAVAGTFSLIRFRSAPGTAREIGAIFMAMAAGLTIGMGYLAYAVTFTFIISLSSFLLISINFGGRLTPDKILRITVPENLAYADAFDDIFDTYLSSNSVKSIKTTNMGSLFKLVYEVNFKENTDEKAFIDALRCRNGNLEIMLSKYEIETGEL